MTNILPLVFALSNSLLYLSNNNAKEENIKVMKYVDEIIPRISNLNTTSDYRFTFWRFGGINTHRVRKTA